MNDYINKLASPLLLFSGMYQKKWRRTAPESANIAVLYYHRIVADSSDNDNLFADEKGITADVFEAHLRFMLKHFEPVRPADIVSSLEKPGMRFTVTFDDGYEDNYSVAAPILRRLGIPACFFVVGDYVDSDRLFWWEQLSNMLRTSEKSSLDVRETRPQWVATAHCPPVLSLNSYEDKFKAQAQLATAMRYADSQDIDRHLEDLAQALEVPNEKSGRLFALMDWAQLRNLADQGFDIGGHTATHVNLGQASSEDIQKEIIESTRNLNQKMGTTARVFAYPYGTPKHYTSEVADAVRSAGYDMAFTTSSGIVDRDSKRFQMPRVKLTRGLEFSSAYNINKAFDNKRLAS